MSQGNGDLLARVVELIAEVRDINKRLDAYMLRAEARDREWDAWRKETDNWRREVEGWRREITENLKLAAITIHSASRVLQDLDRRVAALEEKRPGG